MHRLGAGKPQPWEASPVVPTQQRGPQWGWPPATCASLKCTQILHPIEAYSLGIGDVFPRGALYRKGGCVVPLVFKIPTSLNYKILET